MSAHGTRTRYVAGCRCEQCRKANSRYAARRERIDYVTSKVDSTDVRAHVQWLRDNGMGTRSIAEAAGVARSTIAALECSPKTGRPKSTVDINVARRLLAVHHDLPAGANIDAIGLRRRIQALAAIGWCFAELDRRLGHDKGYTSHLALQGNVRVASRDKIINLYDELWCVEPPNTTRAERYARSRILNLARRNLWPSPLAWDDDTIDDPNAEPQGFVVPREAKARPLADVIEDFEDTRDHHGGLVIIAADRLRMKPETLERQLFRAREAGIDVQFDTTGVHARAAS